MVKLRLQDFQDDGEQYVLRFQEKGGKAREIPVRLELQRDILAYLAAAGIAAENKDRLLFHSTVRRTKQLTGNATASTADTSGLAATTSLALLRATRASSQICGALKK